MNEDDINYREDDWTATARGKFDLLTQVKIYQHVIREICPFLDPYETAVLVQIVDRIHGWQKLEAYVNTEKLLNGDPAYGGIARVMHRSRMMKALRTLEIRGVIRRRRQSNNSPVRIYKVNFDVDLAALEASAPNLRAPRPMTERQKRSSPETTQSQMVHSLVSVGDDAVSFEDPREEYEDKSNIEGNKENSNRRPKLAASDAHYEDKTEIRKVVRPAQARPGQKYEINPRPRPRPNT